MILQNRLPILAVRGSIIFPGMVINLDVGRQKSVQAIEKAVGGDRKLLLVSQKDANAQDTVIADLLEHGTLAVIKQFMRMPNGVVRLLVEGLERVSVTDIQDANALKGYIDGAYDIIQNVQVSEPDEAVLRSMLMEGFEQWAAMTKKVQDDIMKVFRVQQNPAMVGDMIAGYLPLPLAEKEVLLAESNVKRRLIHLLHLLTEQLEYEKIRQGIEQEVHTQLDKNQREYYLREKIKVIHKELGDSEDLIDEIANYRKKAEGLPLPKPVAEKVATELKRLAKLPSTTPESGVIRDYVEALLGLPWGKSDEENYDLAFAEQVLNRDHYGLEKVKERILEFLAVRILKRDGKAPIICLVGPPGVGKTSLAASIAEAVGRRFTRLSLGGVRDEAEIRGHRRTYIGAMPGRIIHAVKGCGCVNPLICLDEIDKLSSDVHGDPASALLEALDPEQNHSFSDHYIEFPFDLSKVFWIVTANSLEPVPAALRDRMEVIELSSYTEEEKLKIAELHLLPRQREANGLTAEQLRVELGALKRIVRDYTMEAGVRNLERKLAELCRKVAVKLVHNSLSVTETGETDAPAEGKPDKYVVTSKNVEEFLGPVIFVHDKTEIAGEVGIVNGLAWTSVGGELLKVEVLTFKGKGHLTLTGQLGDVMKESAQAGYTYIRSRAKRLGIAQTVFEDEDLHIHCPAGAIPKDGPSAGVTMVTAMVSALTGRKTRRALAMTGEITLSGRVLAVGGIKEKMLAAHRAGVKTVLLPYQNLQDLDKLPPRVQKEMEFIGVKHVDEVLKYALEK